MHAQINVLIKFIFLHVHFIYFKKLTNKFYVLKKFELSV